jgi:hypothetical protein
MHVVWGSKGATPHFARRLPLLTISGAQAIDLALAPFNSARLFMKFGGYSMSAPRALMKFGGDLMKFDLPLMTFDPVRI